MKIETVKSYILSILVIISLLLTFSLWNYKPNYSTVKGNINYLNEIDLGGTEQTKRSIIHPSKLIFHKDKDFYSFTDPNQNQNFYKRMQEWTLDDFKTNPSNGIPKDKNYIELKFPTDLPLAVAKSIFKLNIDHDLPNWSFNSMYIRFVQSNSALQIKFISIDEHQEVTFIVKDSSVYKSVYANIQSEKNQSEYFVFGSKEVPIYLPKDDLQISSRSMSVDSINVKLLVSALFSEPSLVNPNSNEEYLSDGQRRIKLLEDRRSMEFIHPMHSQNDRASAIDLLDRSLASINSHKGWTDSYFLDEINSKTNLLRYRMKYNGYPVFNKDGLSIIEQEMINIEPKAYRRPLFSLSNTLATEKVNVLSGKEVAHFLRDNDVFKNKYIKDIQIGYRLTYFDRVSHTLSLDPAWYMDYNGSWIEIRVDQFDNSNIGGY